MESKASMILLKETVVSKAFPSSLSSLADAGSDPLLDSSEKELLKRAKALVFGPKTPEVIDVDDWNFLELVLSLDKGWILMGEGQAKRTVSRQKAKSKKESKEGSIGNSSVSTSLNKEEKENEISKREKEVSRSCFSKGKEDPQTCNVCQQKLPNYKVYLRHLQDLHNLFKCPYCTKFITQRSHLYRHIRCVHRDVKNFSDSCRGHICQICFQKFSQRDDLEEHLNGIHEDVAEYKKTHLTEEEEEEEEEENEGDEEMEEETQEESEAGETESEESEDEEDAYRCQICYKEFQSNLHLRRHKNSVHPKVSERVECMYCKKFYSSPELLKTHYERFHKVKSRGGGGTPKDNSDNETEYAEEESEDLSEEEESLPCPQCRATLKSSRELREHLKTKHGFSNEGQEKEEAGSPVTSQAESYECHICHKFLKTQKIQRRHLKNVHKMKLKKLQSSKKISHFKHKQSSQPSPGSSKQKAVCFKCDLVVANKSNLKRHLIRIHGYKSNISIEDVLNSQSKDNEESENEDSFMEEDEVKEETSPSSIGDASCSDVETTKTTHENKKTGMQSSNVDHQFVASGKTIMAHLVTSPKIYSNFKCRICNIQFNKMPFLKKHLEREHVKGVSSESAVDDDDDKCFHGFNVDTLSKSILCKVELIDSLDELMNGECVVVSNTIP